MIIPIACLWCECLVPLWPVFGFQSDGSVVDCIHYGDTDYVRMSWNAGSKNYLVPEVSTRFLTLEVPRYLAGFRRPLWMTYHGIIESQPNLKENMCSLFVSIVPADGLALHLQAQWWPTSGPVYIPTPKGLRGYWTNRITVMSWWVRWCLK